jgi:heat shock protein HtpX
LQYHLPVEEYREFQAKYGKDMVVQLKTEIYNRTLAVGKEPTCKLGRQILKKYGITCNPRRESYKVVNVYDIVKKAAEKFNLPVPKIVVSNSMMPNAAANGPSPSRGVVVITTGLLAQLNDEEILNVVGHELGHLQGRDPIILFVLTSAEFLLRIFVFLPIFLLFPFFYLMVALGIVYFIAKFFEARADLLSAIKIGQPRVLAEALQKIGYQKLQYERLPTYKIQSWIRFDTHPPIYFRIDRLKKLKPPLEVKYPLLQSIKDVFKGFKSVF